MENGYSPVNACYYHHWWYHPYPTCQQGQTSDIQIYGSGNTGWSDPRTRTDTRKLLLFFGEGYCNKSQVNVYGDNNDTNINQGVLTVVIIEEIHIVVQILDGY